MPGTITEDQLRALLAACPHFDREQNERIQGFATIPGQPVTFPEGYLPDPVITFDPQADSATAIRLMDILYEEYTAFINSQTNQPNGSQPGKG